METQVTRHTGRVVKIFGSERKGYICSPDRSSFFFDITMSPKLGVAPQQGTWVSFDVLPAAALGFDDRAINIEVI